MDVAPCALIEVHRHFGEKYYLHLQDLRAGEQERSGKTLLSACMVGLLLGSPFLRNVDKFLDLPLSDWLLVLLSETSVNYQTARRYISQDGIILICIATMSGIFPDLAWP
jgi:hypothetical protein